MIEHEIHALVERKTLDNMLSDISQIQVLHQQLTELSAYRHAALVIEAQYSDFYPLSALVGGNQRHIWDEYLLI